MNDRAAWDAKYTLTAERSTGSQLVQDVERTKIGRVLRDFTFPSSRVLEAGSGTGRILNFLALTSGAVGVGIDFSMVGNIFARETAKGLEVPCRFVCGDLLEMPFHSNTFDMVFSDSVVEHLADPLGAISEMARVVRPGGLVIITTPNRLRPDGWDLYTRRFKPDYLTRSFLPWEVASFFRKAGLEVCSFFGDTLLLFRNFNLTRQMQGTKLGGRRRLAHRMRRLYSWLESGAERLLHPYLWVTIGVVGRKAADK